MQTQLRRASGKYGLFGLVYTYSKSMDISDNGQLGNLLYADPAYWDRNWALTGYDRKHNFQFYSVLKNPFNQKRSLVGYLARGWQLTNIVSVVSGTPITVTSSSTPLNAPGNTQFADRVPGIPRILNKNTNGVRQYLNPSAWVPEGGVHFGDSGRNSIRGPGFFSWTASLNRSFPIHRNILFAFRADAFNVTNTPRFSNPAAVSGNGGFGQLLATSANSNRTLRFSGHITF